MLFWNVAVLVVVGSGANRSVFKIDLGTLRDGAGVLGGSIGTIGELLGGTLATLRDGSGVGAGGSGSGLATDVNKVVI